MNYFTNVFLRIEDKARKYFEKLPFLHAFLAGVGVILFWRGAWEVADWIGIGAVSSVVIGSLLLGCIGLFVQTFVGNAIIIKSVEKEKKVEQKTVKEVKEEEITLEALARKIDQLQEKIDTLGR